MYRSFESIKNWQIYDFLKIFVILGGNTPPTKSSWGDTSATLPNRNGRYQGTTCTSWLNFYTPCKSQPISLPYYVAWRKLSQRFWNFCILVILHVCTLSVVVYILFCRVAINEYEETSVRGQLNVFSVKSFLSLLSLPVFPLYLKNCFEQ